MRRSTSSAGWSALPSTGETGKQGPDLRPEQAAGREVRQEMMHGQQHMDFLGAETQAGQLILRADPLSGLLEVVAAQAAVEADRRVEPVAHVVEVALELGPREAEAFLQPRAGEAVAGAENLVDLVDPCCSWEASGDLQAPRDPLCRLGRTRRERRWVNSPRKGTDQLEHESHTPIVRGSHHHRPIETVIDRLA